MTVRAFVDPANQLSCRSILFRFVEHGPVRAACPPAASERFAIRLDHIENQKAAGAQGMVRLPKKMPHELVGVRVETVIGEWLADREEPLRVLGMVSRQVKMVAKMKDALDDGMTVDEATRMAGAPPFKAQAMRDAAKKFERADLFRAFALLSETDVALKGSKYHATDDELRAIDEAREAVRRDGTVSSDEVATLLAKYRRA